MHFVTKFAFAAILSTIKQSLRQVNFLLYQLINTFAAWHHEWFAYFVHTWLSQCLFGPWGIEIVVLDAFESWAGPERFFGLEFALSILPQRWISFLIHLKRRNATEWIITITLQTISKFRFRCIPNDIRVLRQVNLSLRLILHQLTFLIKCQKISKEICIRAGKNTTDKLSVIRNTLSEVKME